MNYKTIMVPLCRHKNKPDAACRKLARCTSCRRVLRSFDKGWLCNTCREADRTGGLNHD